MKNRILFLVATILLIAFTAQSAENTKPTKRGRKHTHVRRSNRGRRDHSAFAGIKLTKEQREKAYKIMAEARKKIFDEVLTKEQQDKVKKSREASKKRRGSRGSRKAAFLKKIDKNKDGKIDDSEKKAVRKSSRKSSRKKKVRR